MAWFDGGLTATLRRISVSGPRGDRDLVLRSFTHDGARHASAGRLIQEARMLNLLAADDTIPAPRLVAFDPSAAEADDPSLLMTALPASRAWIRSVPSNDRPTSPPNWSPSTASPSSRRSGPGRSRPGSIPRT